jgi:U1 small nuclear ribonucleoprotein
MQHFEHGNPPTRVLKSTPASLKSLKAKKRMEKVKSTMAPLIEEYKKHQRESGGEYQGMNCYNTLFVGRLAYEVTEGKLLREFEAFGPIKDLKLITVNNKNIKIEDGGGGDSNSNQIGKSRGYAFIEYEQEEDMKRAYRGADAMRIEGRPIVVDVERGHTVPNWLPRRFGVGLGGTRYVERIVCRLLLADEIKFLFFFMSIMLLRINVNVIVNIVIIFQ